MNSAFVRRSFLFCALLVALAPAAAQAAAKPLEVSGWIPYWRVATGTADVLPHLPALTEINPFGYVVRDDGSLYDAFGLGSPTSSTSPMALALITAAKAKKVRVIPTVMWSDTDAIHAILRKQKTRIALEDRIAALVKSQGFDGIDIDFENKKYEDRDYFSLFLKGLYQRMGNKWVMCTIEARTPVSSRYDGTPPPDATHYVNDYIAINKYCDRVRIMAYDQGAIDVKLSGAQKGPYIPVADPQWVEKVLTLAAKTIAKKKLVIGIPTYGYEYQVTRLSLSGYRYDLLWALNPRYGTELAASLNIVPTRNSAGELSFLYTPTSTATDGHEVRLSNNPLPATTTVYAAGFAGATQLDPPQNIVWWSDASAMQDKVALARKLGLRGVAFFKFDGGEDQGLWNLFPAKR